MIAAKVVEVLTKNQVWLVTVESCTGGLIASKITGVPGSSRCFWGGCVTYDNKAKVAMVGVPGDQLEHFGAVSAEVAQSMAEGGLKLALSSLPYDSKVIVIATTGIAGPTGESEGKPIGLCFVSLASSQPTASGKTLTNKINANPSLSRSEIQEYFSTFALNFVLSQYPAN